MSNTGLKSLRTVLLPCEENVLLYFSVDCEAGSLPHRCPKYLNYYSIFPCSTCLQKRNQLLIKLSSLRDSLPSTALWQLISNIIYRQGVTDTDIPKYASNYQINKIAIASKDFNSFHRSNVQAN
jgi:hypothetical protein